MSVLAALRPFRRHRRWLLVVPLLAIALAGANISAERRLAYGIDPDIMQQKLNQAIQSLQTPSLQEDSYKQAIDEAMEALYSSNLVVLPTAGSEASDTADLFNLHKQQAQAAINALTQHVNGGGAARDDAAAARNFVQVTDEALDVIAAETATCDPTTTCPLTSEAHEMPTLIDPVLPAADLAKVRVLRSPFPFVPAPTRPDPVETVINPGAIPNGACAPVVKETRGIQAILRRIKATLWIEPWPHRSAVSRSVYVWAFELVPAEHIKTITYCNNAGTLTQTVSQRIVFDRGVLGFWRGFAPASQ